MNTKFRAALSPLSAATLTLCLAVSPIAVKAQTVPKQTIENLQQAYQQQWVKEFGPLATEPQAPLAKLLSTLPHSDRDADYDTLSSREGLASITTANVTRPAPLAAIISTDVQLNGRRIPVRIYCPESHAARNVLFFIHGGGHLSGSVTVYDPIARRLALATGDTVVAVDYRRAPEAPYPAGLHDARAVLLKVYQILNQHQIAFQPHLTLVGDSGGGAFSATIAQDLQTTKPGFISKLVLIYPSLDYTMSWPSLMENGKGKLLDKNKIAWYFDQYFQHNEDRRAVSPLYRPIAADFPPTLLFSGGLDPLRDEDFAFVARLKQQHVRVNHVHFPDIVHAFLMIENLVPDQANQVYHDIADFVADAPQTPLKTPAHDPDPLANP
ncbi:MULTISPECIES: alpha/beta hydrolase [Ochrobactrum]|uniref:alpha/beta hydrolase n=1 Tax=Ochrobactrum TaxID=528 RepID=UPI00177DF320|nr:alpha/beta hydrolase [Ochrobactrum sp. AN78]MBD7991845.1 alpha/beta hydrolase [Ochrobactrum gallinarum]MDH7792451.1 acetyl esterase [Ochrobactrum sp. AN78]